MKRILLAVIVLIGFAASANAHGRVGVHVGVGHVGFGTCLHSSFIAAVPCVQTVAVPVVQTVAYAAPVIQQVAYQAPAVQQIVQAPPVVQQSVAVQQTYAAPVIQTVAYAAPVLAYAAPVCVTPFSFGFSHFNTFGFNSFGFSHFNGFNRFGGIHSGFSRFGAVGGRRAVAVTRTKTVTRVRGR